MERVRAFIIKNYQIQIKKIYNIAVGIGDLTNLIQYKKTKSFRSA